MPLIKKLRILILISVSALFLTSCATSIPTDREVHAYVSDVTDGELYILRSSQVKRNEKGKVISKAFFFETPRFTFTATASLYPVTIDGAVFGHANGVSSNYVDRVHFLYRSELDDYLPKKLRDWNVAREIDEEALVSGILSIDEIYREELTYHSQEWLTNHPLARVFFTYYPDYSDENSGRYSVLQIKIDGSNTEESVRAKIAEARDLPNTARQRAALIKSCEIWYEGEKKQIPREDIIRELLGLIAQNQSEETEYPAEDIIEQIKNDGFYFKSEDAGLLVSENYSYVINADKAYKVSLNYKEFMRRYKMYLYDARDMFL